MAFPRQRQSLLKRFLSQAGSVLRCRIHESGRHLCLFAAVLPAKAHVCRVLLNKAELEAAPEAGWYVGKATFSFFPPFLFSLSFQQIDIFHFGRQAC